jgi:hypothetical protein
MGFEEGVDRRVTVAMDEERGTAVIDLLHRVVEHALRERQLAPPDLLPRRAGGEVGRGEGGRPPLRRTVGDDLHPADAETIAVVGFVGRWLAREDRVDLGEEGERDDVELEAAAVGKEAEEIELVLLGHFSIFVLRLF